MRVPLHNGIGSIELINQSEPDWKYTPLCEDPGAIARQALADDPTPDASRVRALLANSILVSQTPATPSDSLLRSLEGALRGGTIRLTGWRSSMPERLAPYTQPAKPAKATQAPPRVARQNPAQPPPPEEETPASVECMKEAAEDGAPLVEQADQ